MRSEHFGTEGLKNFNDTVGYRFNLSDVDGVVRYRRQILMIMPKDVRKRQVGIRNQHFEDHYAKVTDEREPYIHPLDTRGEEMREGAEAILDEAQLVHDPSMKPGQVRKETKKKDD